MTLNHKYGDAVAVFEREVCTLPEFREKLRAGGTIEVPAAHSYIATTLAKQFVNEQSLQNNVYKANFTLEFTESFI